MTFEAIRNKEGEASSNQKKSYRKAIGKIGGELCPNDPWGGKTPDKGQCHEPVKRNRNPSPPETVHRRKNHILPKLPHHQGGCRVERQKVKAPLPLGNRKKQKDDGKPDKEKKVLSFLSHGLPEKAVNNRSGKKDKPRQKIKGKVVEIVIKRANMGPSSRISVYGVLEESFSQIDIPSSGDSRKIPGDNNDDKEKHPRKEFHPPDSSPVLMNDQID
jgi:hypothetical protein